MSRPIARSPSFTLTHRASDAEPNLKIVVDVSKVIRDRFVLADYYVSTDRAARKALPQDLAATDAQSFSAATIRLSAIALAPATRPPRTSCWTRCSRKNLHVDALVAARTCCPETRSMNPRRARGGGRRRTRARRRAVRPGRCIAPGRTGIAAAYFEVLKLDPHVNDARVELARLSLVKGKPDEAIQFAREALRAQPGLVEATLILAKAMLTKGDSESAEPHVKQLAREFPKSASAQIELGQLYALKGASHSARGAFEQALTIDPMNIEALSGLTVLDLQAKNPAGARARVDARLAANHDDPRLLVLAARLTRTGDMNATERTFGRPSRSIRSADAYALPVSSMPARRLTRSPSSRRLRACIQKRRRGADRRRDDPSEMQNKPAEARASYERLWRWITGCSGKQPA